MAGTILAAAGDGLQIEFATLCEEFLRAKAAGNRSPMTLRAYRYGFESYTNFCERMGYAEIDLFQSDVIEEFLASGQGFLAEYTIFGYFRDLRALFRWGLKRRLIAENPMEMVETPVYTDKLPKRVTYNEVMQLIVHIGGRAWLDVRDRALIQTLFFCGLRAGEVCRMKIADIDVDQRLIMVKRSKTKSEALIPFPRSLQGPLRAWLAVRPDQPHDYLWVGRNTRGGFKRFEVEGLRMMLRRRCVAAGLPVFNAHSFRHGCAVSIIERGGDISLVQRVLGHADVSTSAMYLKFDTSGLQDLYDRVFA
jgi:site-specific recombinase XerD